MRVDSGKAVDALLKVLRGVCGELPAAEEYVMVHHPAFRVNKKPFGIVGMDEDRKGVTVSVNLGKEAQCSLLEDARFSRTPYIGQHGWVTIATGDLQKGELLMLITESYRRVANKKQLAALDGVPAAAIEQPATRRSKTTPNRSSRSSHSSRPSTASKAPARKKTQASKRARA